jgi:hypothetical protein
MEKRWEMKDAGINSGRPEAQVHLGEEAGPVRLHLHTGRLQDRRDLLGGDGNVVIREDEGGVDAGELAVGHCRDLMPFPPKGLSSKLRTSNLQRIDRFIKQVV